MAKPIKRCDACLGSGKLLPECEPWNKFPGGDCPVCSGHGYPNTVRLKTLCVGDIWQDIHGNEFIITSKDKDGCRIVHQSGDKSGQSEYAPHNPAVRVILRPDMAFFL